MPRTTLSSRSHLSLRIYCAAIFTRRSTRASLALFFLASCVFLSTVVTAQTFTTIGSFAGTGEQGVSPDFVFLVQGLDGNLYGTTQNGGKNASGNVFKVSPTSGVITPIYNFCSLASCADGSTPWGGLVMAPSGILYGATSAGGAGSGTVFKVTTGGTLTTLHSFDGSDGYDATVGLITAGSGNFYGTASAGGASGVGNVYEITPSGTFTSIGSPPGSYADGRLVQGTNGLFYGTTYQGGGVYQMTAAGKFTTLHTFTGGTDGDMAHGPLIQAKDGNLYGGNTGGASGGGVIFKLAPGGKFTTLYAFCTLASCEDGAAPQQGVIQGTDGNFYGTASSGGAYSNGTVFQLTPAGKLTTLHSFCKVSTCPDGYQSYGGLLQATDGNFYGVTFAGGAGSAGTIFRLSMGLKPFVHPITGSGKVGASVTLLGTNLTGATAVSFNGTPSTIIKVTRTWLTTTVPAGSSTGTITVTTPGGVLSSNTTYRVTPQITGFSPSSGAVGAVVKITGVSLSTASHASIGGIAATFTVLSDTEVDATVPAGAVTGKINATTSGGTAVSTTSFTVN